jgi:hypothetical protein
MTRRAPPLVVDSSAWPPIAAALELSRAPWPPEAAALDLAWFRGELEAGRRPADLARPPGRPFLARRWSMTDHQVRSILDANPPPAHRQLTASPVTGEPREVPESHQLTASSPPAGHQLTASRAGAAGADPAHRQAATSPATVQPSQVPDLHQLTASPPPGPPAAVPPVPPLLIATRSDQDQPDLSHAPSWTPTPLDQDPPAATAEARAFLQVYGRWHRNRKAPAPWRTPTPDALAWFLELVGARAADLDGVDLVKALGAWDNWLSGKAEAAGKPGSAKGPKFPINWKNALTNWIENATKFAPRRPRGAWRGARLELPPAPHHPGDQHDPPSEF